MDVNKITFTYREFVWHFARKARHHKLCVLRGGVNSYLHAVAIEMDFI